jgi:hypothetical protein
VQEPVSAFRCSNGTNCVAFPIVGEPAKFSRSNPGPRCFACEERRVAAELAAVAEDPGDEQHRKTGRSRRTRGTKRRERTCVRESCERPAVEWDGTAFVCLEHAEVSRAAAVRKRRGARALTCERAVRAAFASGDGHLERRWAKLLLAAEVRFAETEARLRAAEMRAQPTAQARRARRVPRTGY